MTREAIETLRANVRAHPCCASLVARLIDERDVLLLAARGAFDLLMEDGKETKTPRAVLEAAIGKAEKA